MKFKTFEDSLDESKKISENIFTRFKEKVKDCFKENKKYKNSKSSLPRKKLRE